MKQRLRLSSAVRSSCLALVAAWLLCPPSAATTYSLMEDGDLLDQSAVVARVEVVAVSAAPAIGSPSTDYIVLVERLLKGTVGGTTIVVRIPGGVGPDGVGLRIFGAPRFEAGDRGLLFLSPRSDGTYGVQQLMLGAFHAIGQGEGRLAMRRLEEARLLGGHGLGESDYVRDWDGFQDWLSDRAADRHREPDYFRAVRNHEAVYLPSLLKFQGEPIRFFEFDDGGKVVWKVGKGLAKAKKAFKAAAKAWNSDQDSIVNLERKGRTLTRNGFTRSDGVNAILFNDPNNEVEGFYSCSKGGVIALGGAWFFQSPSMVLRIPKAIGRGKANVAIEADIITNDGTKCLLSKDLEAAAQVLGHELGHTLGLGHSCGGSNCNSREKDALMWPFFHADGRGAVLGSWDRQWIGRLY